MAKKLRVYDPNTGKYEDIGGSKQTTNNNSDSLKVYNSKTGSYEPIGGIDYSDQLDPDVLKSVGDKYKSQWGDKYYYDMFDPEDFTRSQIGAMPKYLEKTYDLNDPVDQWLYQNNLPSKSNGFSDVYSEIMTERRAVQEEEAAYQNEFNGLKVDLYNAMNQAQLDGVSVDDVFDSALFTLLTNGKYKNVASHFAGFKEEEIPEEGTADFYDYQLKQQKKKPDERAFTVADLREEYDAWLKKATAEAEAKIWASGTDAERRNLQIATKTEQLADLETQIAALQNDLTREKNRARGGSTPTTNSVKSQLDTLKEQRDQLQSDLAAATAESKAQAMKDFDASKLTRLEEIEARQREMIPNYLGVTDIYYHRDEAEREEFQALVAEKQAILAEMEQAGLTKSDLFRARAQQTMSALAEQPLPDGSAWNTTAAGYWDANSKNKDKKTRQTVAGLVGAAFVANGAEDQIPEAIRPALEGNNFIEEMQELFQYAEPDEIDLFNRVVASNEADALAFYEAFTDELKFRATETRDAEAEAFANENAVAASVKSVFDQFPAALEGAGNLIGGAFAGQFGVDPVDVMYNSEYTRRANTYTETVANRIASGTDKESTGKALSFLYQTAMSMAQTGARMPLGGVGLAIAGANAASSTMNSVLDQGGTLSQATWLGAVAGAAEAITEKISLESLLKAKARGTVGGFLKESIKQSLIEGSEETASEIINMIADELTRASDSDLQREVDELVASGMSKKEALIDVIVNRVGGAFLGGALSGLLFGAGGQVMQIATTEGKGFKNKARTVETLYQEVGRIAPELSKQFAEDVNAMGLTPADTQFLIETFDGVIENYTVLATQQGRDIVDNLTNTMHALANKVSEQTSRDAAKQQRVINKQTKMYDSIRSAQQEAHAALESGDLTAHRKAAAKYRASMQEYMRTVEVDNYEKEADRAAKAQRDEKNAQDARKVAAETRQRVAEMAEIAAAEIEADNAVQQAAFELGTSPAQVRNALGDDIVSQMVAMQAQLAAEEGYDPLESNESFDEFSKDQMLDDMAVALETGDLDLFNATDEQYNELYRDFDLVDEMVNGGRENEAIQTEGETDGERTDLPLSRAESVFRGREERSEDHRSGQTSGERKDEGVAGRTRRAEFRKKRRLTWTTQQDTDLRGAVEEYNRRYGTAALAANLREATDRSEESKNISNMISGITGRDTFFVAGDLPFGGVTVGGRQYVSYTGDDATDAFNQMHESAHNMPALISAVLHTLDRGLIPRAEFNAYVRGRKDRIAKRRGIPVDEVGLGDNRHLQTEFACDMAGAWAADKIADKEVWPDYGINQDTAFMIKHAIDQSMTGASYAEEDPKSEDYQYRITLEAGAAITAEEAENGITFSENAPVQRSDISRNINKLATMGDVVRLTGNEFAKPADGEYVPLSKRLYSFFIERGRSQFRNPELGTVRITMNSIRSDIRHGNTQNKVTAYAAVGDVIEKGVVIDARAGGAHQADRCVIAAPISIGREQYIMGVMVKRSLDGSNAFYLHDVVAIKKITSATDEIRDSDAASSRTKDDLYITDIITNALKGNTDFINRTKSSQFDFSENAPMTKQERTVRAQQLFEDGFIPSSYLASDPDEFDLRVSNLLRGEMLKNGEDCGGAISESKMKQVLKTFADASNKRALRMTLSSPVRVWEAVSGWGGKTAEERARRLREGNFIKNTYYEYANIQAANREVWIRDRMQPVREAIKNNGEFGAYESAMVQVLGEKLASEDQVKSAVFDGKTMIVEAIDGLFVFDKNGRLLYSSDAHTSTKYSQTRTERIKRAAERQSANEFLEKAEFRQYPLVIERSGQSVTVRDAMGEIVAQVTNGRSPNMDAVSATVAAMRQFYEQSYQEISDVRVMNGYAPPGYIKDYFPHLGRKYGGIEDFVQKLLDSNIPTAINGLTAGFSPGQPWNANLQTRLGDMTEFDAVRGFNKYIKSAADTIFYTPVIQRYRQLEHALRIQGEKAESQAGRENNSAFVDWLHEQANEWANKKSLFDRGTESAIGREAYTLTNMLTSLFSQASVGGSVSSALSNMVGALTGYAQVDPKHVTGAIVRTGAQLYQLAHDKLAKTHNYDGFADKIPFMQRRFTNNEDILITNVDKLKRGGSKFLYFTFSALDRFAVESVARAKYNECIERGMTEVQAIAMTNDTLIKNFADRGKGQAARIFNMKSLKPLLQFQLEVLNQVSHGRDMNRAEAERKLFELEKQYGKDIPWEKLEKQAISGGGIRRLAREAMYLVLLSLWGMITRELMGRDQTWNPVGIAKDAVSDYKDGGAKEVVSGFKETASDNLPFVSTLSGGRVPLMGGVENIGNVLASLISGEKVSANDWISAGTSFVPGGGQIRKTAQGVIANQKGGKYTDDGRLQYPITDDEFWKTVVFGTSAAQPEGYNWQTDILSEKETEAYQEMVGEGMDEETVYDIMLSYGGSNNAQKAMSVAQYADDLTDDEFDLMMEVLDIDYNGSREKYPAWSLKQGEKSLQESRKKYEKGNLKKETLDDYEELFEEYFRLLGMTE